MVYDLLDSRLNYLDRTAKARAGVTIQHGVLSKPVPACLQKGVLFRMKADALIQSMSRCTASVTPGATAFVAVPQPSGGSIVPVPISTRGVSGDKMGRVVLSLKEKRGDNVPRGYDTVVPDEDRPDPPLHTV